MNYKKFSVTDFISDEYFQNWIIQPDEKINNFWNKWLQHHPHKLDSVNQARKVLSNISFKEDIPVNEQVQRALIKNLIVIDTIEQQEKKQQTIVASINRFRNIRKIAAIFIGVLLSGAALFYYNRTNATTTIATNYGEIKTIMLPDSTEIILNAHSAITYPKHWRFDEARKVKLQGEAFLKVNHLNKNENVIKNSERFIVYTNDLKIEVLGTEFDVKNRREKTSVILKTGKVKVAFNHIKREDVTMRPGEMIVYEVKTDQLTQFTTDPLVKTAWMEKKLILKNATVNTIIEYLEDNYGFKVILKDTAIGNKEMEGTLMLDNIKDILFVLSSSLDIKIEKENKTLIFSSSTGIFK